MGPQRSGSELAALTRLKSSTESCLDAKPFGRSTKQPEAKCRLLHGSQAPVARVAKTTPPPLTETQLAMLKSMWWRGDTRIAIAAALSSVSGGVAVVNTQVTYLAKAHNLGTHPKDVEREAKAKPKRQKPGLGAQEKAPMDPLLATKGQYKALETWAKWQKPPLTMTQALQRYHRARAGKT